MRCVVRRQGSALKVTVRTRTSSHEIECAPGERILYAALRAGVGVPYECATGSCGTCKARARPGTVDDVWPQAPGHAYLKRERGEFLMCQGVALGACEILVPSRIDAASATAPGPRHATGTLSAVRSLTRDVDAFSLELDRPVAFDAGQFVVLAAPGFAGYRAYSMVNEAAETSRLEFVIKHKAGGSFSGWLGAGREGGTLDVFGPLGKATWRPEEGKDLLCIAGGSGIAGMMSILSHALSSGHFERHRGDVFFGIRAREDVFFADELARLVQAARGRLSVTVAYSEEPVVDRDPRIPRCIDVAHGFVHLVAGKRMGAAWGEPTAFVAGPPPMVDGALRMLVMDARLPASEIRYDKFT